MTAVAVQIPWRRRARGLTAAIGLNQHGLVRPRIRVLKRFARWMVAILLLCCSPACRHTPTPFPNDAYVWQRVWTPAVIEAISSSAPDILVWRVLAAQTDQTGRLQVFNPDRAALLASGKAVVLVVRIDGQLASWDEATRLSATVALWRDWQRSGIRLAGVEIDHDCGTARLPAYARYLSQLRPLLPGATLSITALPDWIASADLALVLAQVDESVLQVHAVRNPRAGLFDATLALRWALSYAARSDKPFRVALPTYGSRVSWDALGRLASVQSEAGVLDRGDDSRELLATPQVIAGFLRDLAAAAPAHLAGIAWFRLPTAQDDRAWSLPTWRAVMRGQAMDGQATATTRMSGTPGTLDLVLENRTGLDVPLPTRVVLPAACTLADGVNGYALNASQVPFYLTRKQPGLLRGNGLRVIGWSRCKTLGVALHGEP